MTDLAERFTSELRAAGAHVHRAIKLDAVDVLREVLRERAVRSVVRGRLPTLDVAALDASLVDDGVTVTVCDLADGTRDAIREAELVADAGLTVADAALASTGSLALFAGPGSGRALSLLPPIHVAVLDAGTIVPDLASLFAEMTSEGKEMPSALTFVTGPSRTGDIELVLTVGVHGPRELHVVLVE